METLLDIRNAIKDIPDDTLQGLWFGTGEGCEETISLVASETGTISKEQIGFPEVFEKYPKLNEISKLIGNIVKAQKRLDEGDGEGEFADEMMEEGVSSKTFEKEEKKKP